MEQGSGFDWNALVQKIEDCAERNAVLEIDIPKEEWMRLRVESLASLKARLSENAAHRLHLIHGGSLGPDRYFLLVCHLGNCFG